MPPHFNCRCLCMGITPNLQSQLGHLQGLGPEERYGEVGGSPDWRERGQRSPAISGAGAQLWSFSQGPRPLSAPEQGFMPPPGGSCRDPSRCGRRRGKASPFDLQARGWLVPNPKATRKASEKGANPEGRPGGGAVPRGKRSLHKVRLHS